MFEAGFFPFENAMREFGMPPLESPSWEATPSLFPIEAVEWRKRISDVYTYDPVNGPPEIVTFEPDPATYTGVFGSAGALFALEVGRNARHAAQFDGLNMTYLDADTTLDSMGDEWTVFTVLCPRAFNYTGGYVADGGGVWMFSDYYAGLTMFDDAGTPKIRLFAFNTGGGAGFTSDVTVHAGRWCVSTASLGKDNVLAHNIGTAARQAVQMDSPPVPSVSTLQLGYNVSSTTFGEMDLAVFAVSPSGSLAASRARDIQRYFEAVYGPQTPCLVLLDGEVREVPDTAPFGLRVVLSAGSRETSGTVGKSLVLVSGAVVEIPNEEDARVPPP